MCIPHYELVLQQYQHVCHNYVLWGTCRLGPNCPRAHDDSLTAMVLNDLRVASVQKKAASSSPASSPYHLSASTTRFRFTRRRPEGPASARSATTMASVAMGPEEDEWGSWPVTRSPSTKLDRARVRYADRVSGRC